ncbi:MAG: LysR family transcriptional regulator [Xanthomonadales bacterium]|nr:LysR family transcriptional regulator [Xanthomonadales bacterium]
MSKTPRYLYKGDLLKPLKAFCCVAATGNMSRAAEELFLSQPSVSLQVRALEEKLDVVLFERHGPRIRLTPEGQTLYELAKPLVEGLSALPDTFRAALGRLETGSINIASGESTILFILPRLVAAFRQSYPGIHVHLHNVIGKDGLTMIRHEEVDFAVGSMLEVPSDIRYEPIQDYQPKLITALDHPLAKRKRISLQDLSPYGLILPPKRLSTWRIVDLTFQKHDIPYHVALEVGGWEVIKRYVTLNMGISIVTDICLSGDEPLFVHDMSEYFPSRSYGLVMKRGRFFTPQARRFIELTRKIGFSAAEPALQSSSQPPSTAA